MSLDDIQLPAATLQNLFKNTLVSIDATHAAIDVAEKKTINVLGNNKKHILILVENNEAVHLPDDQLNFLLGILAACKSTMDDVAIVNIKNNKSSYETIAKELDPEKVFLFGIAPSKIKLPFQFAHYETKEQAGIVYLSSPSLDVLKDNKIEKSKLWLCLKQIFFIA